MTDRPLPDTLDGHPQPDTRTLARALRYLPPVAALGTAFVLQVVLITDTGGGVLADRMADSGPAWVWYALAGLFGLSVASCLEGGAAYLMDLYDRHLLARDSVWLLRLGMAGYVGVSALMVHWWAGHRGLPELVAWVLAGMSASALFLWSRGSRWAQRREMVAAGQLDPALPRLPGLLGHCHGPDLVQVGYCAMFHLHYTGYHDLAREVATLTLREAQLDDHPVWLGVAEYVHASSLPPETAVLACQLADRAAGGLQQHLGDPRARQAYGMLHLTAALRSAAAGDRGAAMAHLDEAGSEAATLEELPGVCSLAFGPTNVGIWRLAVLAELGQPDAAIAGAGQVDPRGTPVPHRQAAYWIDLGRACATVGRDDQAVTAFLRAETICPQWVRLRHSVRDTVQVVYRRAQRRAVTPQMRRAAQMVGLPL